jgi:hypothetical protein
MSIFCLLIRDVVNWYDMTYSQGVRETKW